MILPCFRVVTSRQVISWFKRVNSGSRFAPPLLPTKVDPGTDEAGAKQRGARGHIETMKTVECIVQKK